MKLKNKILALFIAFAVVPLIIISVFFANTYNQGLRDVMENDLKVATNTIVTAIQAFLHECETDVNVIAQYDDTLHLINTKEPENNEYRTRLEAVIRSRVDNNQYLESFSLLDENFNILACTQAVKPRETSVLKDLPNIKLLTKVTYTHVSINSGGETAQKSIAVIKPVFIGTQLKGYVVGQINLNFFEKLRQSAVLINDGTVYLTDSKSQMIMAGTDTASRTEFVLNKDETEDYRSALLQLAPDATEGTFSYKAAGKNYMSNFKILPEVNWRLTSSICIDSIVESQKVYINIIVFVFITVGITMLALNFIVHKSLVHPIEKMVDVFRCIRAQKNYEMRMPTSGGGEILQISTQINMLLRQVDELVKDERKKQDELREFASKDQMTNVYNKTALVEIIKSSFKIAHADKSVCACMFVDIDDFKDFNTLYGHLVGDKVIKYVAATLATAQLGDVGRMGGDEFMICISSDNVIQNLDTHIKRILRALNSGITEGEEPIKICCSIGVAMLNDNMQSAADLIEAADTAMYNVKHNAKNGYVIIK